MPYREDIDCALVRIGDTLDVPEAAIRGVLGGLPSASGPLGYLVLAGTACHPLFPGAGELISASQELHLDTLWLGELEWCIQCHPMLQRESDPPPAVPPTGRLDPAYYPPEVGPAFAQGLQLKARSAVADLILLWKRPAGIAVMHAHPEGFWEIAPNPVRWIERLADVLETGHSAALIQWRIRDFVEECGAARFSVVSTSAALRDTVESGELADWMAAPGARRDDSGVQIGASRIDIHDDLRPTQLSAQALLCKLQQGQAVWLDVSLAERASWGQAEPTHHIVATASADIKRQLHAIAAGSLSATFALAVAGKIRKGLSPRRLLRQSAAIAAARRQGHDATVTAERTPRVGGVPSRRAL